MVNIPCPGSKFVAWEPLPVVGCIFQWQLPSDGEQGAYNYSSLLKVRRALSECRRVFREGLR